jgi:CBS domain-containing protein
MDVVGDIMTKKVITCTTEDSLLKIQTLLVKHRISRVVVTDREGKPTGILTQKDIVDFLLADTSKRGIEEIPAKEVMSKNLITAKPITPIPEAAKIMNKNKISSVLVVDEDGKLEGITTKVDISLFFASKGAGIYRVHDFMTPDPITVRQSQSIFLAVSLMSQNQISRIVVADEKAKPVGIITLTDVTMISRLLKPARVIKEEKPVFLKGLLFPPKGVHLLTAKDFMTADPISVNEDADLAEAARLMTKNGVSGLPVINNAGKLVGIITKSDLTEAVASLKK